MKRIMCLLLLALLAAGPVLALAQAEVQYTATVTKDMTIRE